jgi:hypothetical protein
MINVVVNVVKGIYYFLLNNNIMIPIGLFLFDRLFEIFKEKTKPVYDLNKFQTLLAEKGYC